MEYELAHELAAEGISDSGVLAAVMRVDRTAFVPGRLAAYAHTDEPLPIGYGQTISQPYVVAAMSAALGVKAGDRVLEVGTGSGYQAAVLCELGCHVFSIERIASLAEQAKLSLSMEGYDVNLRVGDGATGWPEKAPFRGIIVTAGTREPPPTLLEQLTDGGRMVIPLGATVNQRLCIIVREGPKYSSHEMMSVRFVPLDH